MLAQEPPKEGQLPAQAGNAAAQEQHKGCGLPGFLARAALVLLSSDSSSQVFLLPKH